MDEVYGNRLLKNLRTRKRRNIVPGKFRDEQETTSENVLTQLHALSPMQDMKEYAQI